MKSGETRSQVKSGDKMKSGETSDRWYQVKPNVVQTSLLYLRSQIMRSGDHLAQNQVKSGEFQTLWSTHQQSCAKKYWCLLPPGTKLLSLASIISTSFFFSLFASSSSDRWQMFESDAVTSVTFRFSDGREYIVGGGVKACSLEPLKIWRISAIPDSAWSHVTFWSGVFMIWLSCRNVNTPISISFIR